MNILLIGYKPIYDAGSLGVRRWDIQKDAVTCANYPHHPKWSKIAW